MSNLEKLIAIDESANALQRQADIVRGQMDDILKPMFDEQCSLASSIANEDEFQELEKKYHYGHPRWNLIAPGSYGYEYSRGHNDCFWMSSIWNDGEQAPDTKLLPEFVDGSLEQKKEAIRNFYRKFLQEKKDAEISAAQKEIDKARATLLAAGITV